ncbi:hypothetical protein [Actinoplanes sp. NBRC 103695]|uniref:hypothetical protein n=1 Tax=Actinoplanes sp. NBRC 103695 TaxID=3032202 RepID=UPI0024A1D6FB|nr:hypothetical protein [Actinoplanes sp. NBRC 103695]GLZ01619.1 hypothetical protein Acsp02_88700 [Actinoplanes sp. NBRC 103695]
MTRPDLPAQARAFANKIRTLLNQTVADHAQVSAGVVDADQMITVGTHLSLRDLSTKPTPLLSSSKDFQCFLDVQYQLFLEKTEDHYLTVATSFFGVYGLRDAKDPFFHYDYERNKAGYTEAHVQVLGENTGLTPMMHALCTRRKKKSMGELHFPVGGRRFRPALEDVLEFLIDEQLINAKDDWRERLSETREEFRDIQLKAAIRQNPQLARDVLSSLPA